MLQHSVWRSGLGLIGLPAKRDSTSLLVQLSSVLLNLNHDASLHVHCSALAPDSKNHCLQASGTAVKCHKKLFDWQRMQQMVLQPLSAGGEHQDGIPGATGKALFSVKQHLGMGSTAQAPQLLPVAHS